MELVYSWSEFLQNVMTVIFHAAWFVDLGFLCTGQNSFNDARGVLGYGGLGMTIRRWGGMVRSLEMKHWSMLPEIRLKMYRAVDTTTKRMVEGAG
jgi:hypothetical protein